MRILQIAYHGCIRMTKQNIALQQFGHNVHLLTHGIANKDLKSALQSVTYYTDQDNFKARLRSIDLTQFDIVHVHNEPNWLGTWPKKIHPKCKLVFDAHDLDSVRAQQVSKDEAFVFENSDGFVFPCDGYYEHAINLHGISAEKGTVVLSAVNDILFPKYNLPYQGGIVYEGAVTGTPRRGGRKAKDAAKRRDYRDVARYSVQCGIPFTVLGTRDHALPEYEETGAIIFKQYPYLRMIYELTRYGWGIIGNGEPSEQRRVGMPNKLFEYIAAGIPVIAFGGRAVMDFVTKHNFGIAINKMEEIPSTYPRQDEYQNYVQAGRKQFTMETEIKKVLKLYDNILGK